MFNICKKLRFFAGQKDTSENQAVTMRAAANTIEALRYQNATLQKALELLCRETGADYNTCLAAARREMLCVAVTCAQ